MEAVRIGVGLIAPYAISFSIKSVTDVQLMHILNHVVVKIPPMKNG